MVAEPLLPIPSPNRTRAAAPHILLLLLLLSPARLLHRGASTRGDPWDLAAVTPSVMYQL